MDWLTTELIWRLSAVDFAVMLTLGMLVSATAWMVTEFVKRGGRRGRVIVWIPGAYCLVQAAWLFPAALLGVNPEHTMPWWVQGLVIVTLLTPAGGLGAKAAHDWGDKAMQATLGRLIDVIRPREGTDV